MERQAEATRFATTPARMQAGEVVRPDRARSDL